MAKSLRTFLDEISKHRPDDLKEVTRPVDAEHEVAALLSKLQRQQQFPAVLFRNVGGSDHPVLINLHASYERMAIAMGVANVIEMQQVHAEREANLRPLRWVDKDRCSLWRSSRSLDCWQRWSTCFAKQPICRGRCIYVE